MRPNRTRREGNEESSRLDDATLFGAFDWNAAVVRASVGHRI